MKLKIENIGFGYASTPIIEEIFLEIALSQVVTICGPNGVGKSTLMRCINRILKPSKGTIFLDGRQMSRMSQIEIARKIGYVSQSSSNAFPVSVFDMVLTGRRPHIGWRSSEADTDKVVEILRLMGMEDLALRDFNELSGGQQQKIIISRALAQEPDILLLDEPTSNLDIRHQLEVMEIIRNLAMEKGISVVIAVHDLNLAARYADRVVMMKNGRVFCKGDPESVLTPENIMSVYGVESAVKREDGKPYIVPIRYKKAFQSAINPSSRIIV